ncbi:hypothetical protein HPB51_001312 [Rhipicephalus microplus]|uniref:Uncharacterized protein n=1 Tax=Rhipicephalus microplus TaxID=6941 RepID=A0A9J6DXV8_RHIMP|nr:hypothetical protein HPB51_001312 [Rhipicephalus microplus]
MVGRSRRGPAAGDIAVPGRGHWAGGVAGELQRDVTDSEGTPNQGPQKRQKVGGGNQAWPNERASAIVQVASTPRRVARWSSNGGVLRRKFRLWQQRFSGEEATLKRCSARSLCNPCRLKKEAMICSNADQATAAVSAVKNDTDDHQDFSRCHCAFSCHVREAKAHWWRVLWRARAARELITGRRQRAYSRRQLLLLRVRGTTCCRGRLRGLDRRHSTSARLVAPVSSFL